MTADMNAAGVWQQLTADEREALQKVASGITVDKFHDWSRLFTLELFMFEYHGGEILLTDLGKRVLEAGQPANLDSGAAAEPPTDEQVTNAGADVDARRYENYTHDDLLARVIDQDRIIHELYTGKHGVIPHPSDVYQAGLWEIYKPDEYQGHAERVGDVGELAALRERVTALAGAVGESLVEIERFAKADADGDEDIHDDETYQAFLQGCLANITAEVSAVRQALATASTATASADSGGAVSTAKEV
jgi:hypothetical protein